MKHLMRCASPLFLLASLAACGTSPDGYGAMAQGPANAPPASAVHWAQQVEYLPIQPFFSGTYTDYSTVPTKEKTWASIAKNSVRGMLPNQNSTTTVKRFESEGKVTYLTFDSSAKGKNYEVVMEWMKYRFEPVTFGEEKTYGKVGVGMRVRANIVALEGGISLNGLVGLAAAVKANQLRGSIAVDLIGIDSEGVSALLPLGVNLDESSIQQALQTLAAVQTKVYDANVTLTPHVMALRNAPDVSAAKDPAEAARLRAMQK
ncbi:MAG: hypothetical protein K2X44_06775 [Magnetospirillum sp.]|nr:hypothetical protein [Magnetospirillum sp.]